MNTAYAALALIVVGCTPSLPRGAIKPPQEEGPRVHLVLPPTVPSANRQPLGRPLLERRDAAGTWTPVCDAPCKAALDTRYEYRVGGVGVTPSDGFHLPRGRDVEIA